MSTAPAIEERMISAHLKSDGDEDRADHPADQKGDHWKIRDAGRSPPDITETTT